MNIGKKPEKYLTYTCELDGCEKTKTVYKSAYSKNTYHYCSIDCLAIARSKKIIFNGEHGRRKRDIRRKLFIRRWNNMEW